MSNMSQWRHRSNILWCAFFDLSIYEMKHMRHAADGIFRCPWICLPALRHLRQRSHTLVRVDGRSEAEVDQPRTDEKRCATDKSHLFHCVNVGVGIIFL